MARRGVYPGSFDPLTVAHLAVAEAVVAHHRLARLDLVISRVAIGKEERADDRLAERVEAIERAASSRPWLGAVVTGQQLLADIAEGYDVVVMGADKWAQILDPVFYESAEHHAAALARMPTPAVVPRPPHPCPDQYAVALPEHLADVSSSAVRAGRRDWMAPEAREVAAETGAWEAN